MELNKHNIQEIIENYLKEKRLRFDMETDDSGCLYYKIFVGSMEVTIFAEIYLNETKDEDWGIQFHTPVNNNGLSIYQNDINSWGDTIPTKDDLEEEIGCLLDKAKILNSAISKIENKIQQIRDICDENKLEFDDFIDVLYDFEN